MPFVNLSKCTSGSILKGVFKILYLSFSLYIYIYIYETLERFNKKKPKKIIVNDLQHEITIIKKEIIELKK